MESPWIILIFNGEQVARMSKMSGKCYIGPECVGLVPNTPCWEICVIYG